MKNITILGSTGSIGTQTLDVIRKYRADFCVYALVAGTSTQTMFHQIEEFHPKLAVMKDEEHADKLSKLIDEVGIEDKPKILYGMDGYLKAVTAPEVETVVAAMVGMIGLRPVLSAIEHGKDIALANKETLVCAGHLIMKSAKEHKVRILPVDSEHSAIFQCLQGLKNGPFEDGIPVETDGSQIETIFLTASGGPFRKASQKELESVTVEQALAHPNWSMGAKITTDSATMINKGLEIIEAKWLFGIPLEKVHVLVQPKSIIHSMVGFADGAVLAQLGSPDMRVPIQYALLYPDRRYLDDQRLDFETLASIEFEKPNTDVLRGIPLAIDSARIGGTMTTVMNAANEYAVAKFLDKKISFLRIYELIEYAMEHHKVIDDPNLDQILEAERWVYDTLDGMM